jgi:ribonuclease HI
MPWVSRLLRGERVWARANDAGAVHAGSDGRVDILYKPGGKVYRAAARNLSDDPDPRTLAEKPAEEGRPAPAQDPGPAVDHAPTRSRRRGARAGAGSAQPHHGAGDAIIVYADGACTGNPGPCGIGVVLLDGPARREFSEYLGLGTNNIAELTAIVRALEEAPRDRTVIVHSDSAYALGLLGRGWKAKANGELVARMREIASQFHDLRLVKVAGHAGIVENERADELAREAVVRRR